MNEKCKHKRVRRVHRFGKNQKPDLYCKDCGKVVKRKERRKKYEKSS